MYGGSPLPKSWGSSRDSVSDPQYLVYPSPRVRVEVHGALLAFESTPLDHFGEVASSIHPRVNFGEHLGVVTTP